MSVCCVHADVSCEQWMWEKKKASELRSVRNQSGEKKGI